MSWKGGDRNRKCYCGSGIKYKYCHYLIERGEKPLRKPLPPEPKETNHANQD